ncbi:AraC family transcriptional regulator [Dictyobacter vulcani]|uniref:AraC family transcriptional regulator n=1 Tax=Dictyobacter vulcani TaxID=2607529 RepID=A0A5J4KR69_9CHLR|nr:helix-turn-helix domain-containing protein [Dictyobacter vulcani]GER88847.1 AraC family transcriptional regulator [Dictyobacter vulcani]
MMLHHDLTIDMTIMGLSHGHMQPSLMPQAHRHAEVELNFTERGAITYLFGGDRITVGPGQLAFFWATLPHQVIDVQQKTIFHWLTIPFSSFLHWRLPPAFVQQIISGSCTLGKLDFTLMQTQFRQWRDDLQAHTEEQKQIVLLEVEACVRRLALTTQSTNERRIDTPSSTNMEPHLLSKVELMSSFIAEHYTEQLHTKDVAAAAHLHPNYAMKLFHKHIGMSMLEYITRYRLAHAQRLLITTDINITEIALAAGFGSVSRFYSVFKASCGLLPGAYRSGLRLKPD